MAAAETPRDDADPYRDDPGRWVPVTSAASDGTGGPSGSVPLGQILVGRGLLSEEQLQAALEEGQRTGEQIGSAIVRLGLLPASTIAQALATQ